MSLISLPPVPATSVHLTPPGIRDGNQGNQGQAPHFGELRDILSDSAHRFDIPAHEQYYPADGGCRTPPGLDGFGVK